MLTILSIGQIQAHLIHHPRHLNRRKAKITRTAPNLIVIQDVLALVARELANDVQECQKLQSRKITFIRNLSKTNMVDIISS